MAGAHDDFTVQRTYLRNDVGLNEVAAVGEHGVGGCHLQGRDADGAAADGELCVSWKFVGSETEPTDVVDHVAGANLQQHPHRNQVDGSIQGFA